MRFIIFILSTGDRLQSYHGSEYYIHDNKIQVIKLIYENMRFTIKDRLGNMS